MGLLRAAICMGAWKCSSGGYAIQALANDMIGLFTTHSLPIMAPWGGAERLIGNNPLAIALPARRRPPIAGHQHLRDAQKALAGGAVGRSLEPVAAAPTG